MRKYKVEFKGFAYIEAHTEGEAIEKLYDGDYAYAEYEEAGATEVEELEVEL